MDIKRFLCKRVPAVLLALFIGLPSSGAMAEYLGLIVGREATPARTTNFSVDLGFVIGELGAEDYQNIAARLSYRLTTALLVSGTVGVSEFGDSDGVPFGLGLMYHFSRQRISPAIELAAKANYNTGDFSVGPLNGDLRNLTLEFVVSGAKPLLANGLSWYSNVGFHRITVDFEESDSANELGLGAGLVLPIGFGEAFFGVEYIDKLTGGLGIRYFVSN